MASEATAKGLGKSRLGRLRVNKGWRGKRREEGEEWTKVRREDSGKWKLGGAWEGVKGRKVGRVKGRKRGGLKLFRTIKGVKKGKNK